MKPAENAPHTPPRGVPANTRMPMGLLAVVLGAGFVVGSLSFLVAVRAAQLQNGYRIYAVSREKAELLEQRSHLQVEVASLTRPDRLARVALEFGLGPVRPDQIIRAPGADAPGASSPSPAGEVTP